MVKRIRQYALILSSITLVSFAAWKAKEAWSDNEFRYVDFDQSMQLERYNSRVASDWDHAVLNTARQLYERNNAQTVCMNKTVKIPRIIHQIWLGSPFPEKYKAWQKSWMTHHPGWDYKLWTEEDVRLLHKRQDFFIGDTYRYYQEASNYAEQSDILRLLLLYHYGGLYVDTDYECLKSCEILHHYYDFYIGLQPLDVSYVQLGFALIGCIPHHPFVQLMLATIAQRRSEKRIIDKTGPLMATYCFIRYALRIPGTMVALPASYFYPRCYHDPLGPRTAWQKPESFAVHHWEGSWLLPQAQRKGAS